MTSEAGQVRFTPRGTYTGTVVHSFGNASSTEDVLIAGTTHVAVGFLDLGQLSCARVQPGRGDLGLAAAAPLQWIGYDSSAYSVAKSYVRSDSFSRFLQSCFWMICYRVSELCCQWSQCTLSLELRGF